MSAPADPLRMTNAKRAAMILPCPFCGAPGYLMVAGHGFQIKCTDTECTVETPIKERRCDVLDVWNRRAALATKPAPADPLRDLAQAILAVDIPHGQEAEAAQKMQRLAAAALATKPAETADRVRRLQDAIEGECDGLAITVDHARAILEYVDDHPTESAGKAVQRPVDAVRDGLHRLFGTEAGRVSVEVERAAHGLDFSPQALLSAVKILRRLAETQRSSNANGSDEPTISDPAISGLADTRLETERGAVQPPAPAITERELAFALNYHSDDSRINDADWKIARRYFEVIERNRGTHPSLQGHPTESAGKAVQRPVDHELKTWPEFYAVLESGEKTFEIRENDRGFRAGNVLRLNEWARGSGYTGRFMDREVTYLLEGPAFGLGRGYVAMALGPVMTASGFSPEAHGSDEQAKPESGVGAVQPPSPEPLPTIDEIVLSVMNDADLYAQTCAEDGTREHAVRAERECLEENLRNLLAALASPSIAQRGAALTDDEIDAIVRKHWRRTIVYSGLRAAIRDCIEEARGRAALALSPEDAE